MTQETGIRTPSVRVGIVSWNTAELLDQCLSHLPDALRGTDWTVVVVDNASSDRSADVAEGHGIAKVIRNPENVGYARAMNQALASDGPVPDALIALNPDTVTPAGSLTALVHRLLADRDIGLVVPRLNNPDGSSQQSVYRFPSPGVAAVASLVPMRWIPRLVSEDWWLEGHSRHDRSCDIDWAIGAVHVLNPAAVDPRTPYSERWFMYVEDLDLCWALSRSGWRRRLEGDIVVTHVGNAAGAKAWGAGRTRRWLSATYEWYRSVHGAGGTSLWAATNVIGVSSRIAGAAFRRLRGRPVQGWERDLVRAFPIHLRNLLPGRAQR